MPDESEPITLALRLAPVGRYSEGEIDDLTRSLAREIGETGVVDPRMPKEGEVPPGAKAGEAVTIGTLLLDVLPDVVPQVVSQIAEWIGRGANPTVKLVAEVGGRRVEVEFPPRMLEAREVSDFAREIVDSISPRG